MIQIINWIYYWHSWINPYIFDHLFSLLLNKSSFEKPDGRSSSIFVTLYISVWLDNIIYVSSSENSEITYLHAPQGLPTFTVSQLITINFIFFKPFVTPENIAFLSAQIVNPYEEFSTLHPICLFSF